MTAITIGSDPELHLYDKHTGGVVSSLKVLRRDKTCPVELGDGVRMYADNVLTETSFPPVKSPEELVTKMRSVFTSMQKSLTPRFELLPKAAHFYDRRELLAKAAWEIGCNPSYNCYSQRENKIVEFQDRMRTGSFHIHIGHPLVGSKEKNVDGNGVVRWVPNEHQEVLVKLLDETLGCASVLFDKDPTNQLRRKYYGRAGEFRPTPYGVEYRVLGNGPLRHPLMVKLVADLAFYVVSRFDAGCSPRGTLHHVNAINSSDRVLAMSVIDSTLGLPDSLKDRMLRKYGYAGDSFNTNWEI